ncbi:GmrSD restriction endonuclease domain-containing protein [Marinomonas gallaica]|uniref:GmrSD restriction endonuclease domain-containing protein n=1 Tax=Marinomonas gallaica TaxID=1806667 RepID=UPI003CE52471
MSGKNLTFFNLFNHVSTVEVPILQRDYAQGRTEENEVRTLFLRSLFKTLTQNDHSDRQSLDLDFVYGNYENITNEDTEKNEIFSVLDGQQRLTTLFLLHWYLAVADECIEQFKLQFLTESGKSRFTYKTRPSSSEFFDALASRKVDFSNRSVSESIIDSHWFFLSWRQDPTVQACLNMLDSIQDMFAGNEAGLFLRLCQIEKPYITFQFLNLHSFGLSDELYIKMNARGKPLTVFENFKAKLEQYIESYIAPWPAYELPFRNGVVNGYEYFIHKIDTDWADLFWPYRNICSTDNSFDDEFMHFFRQLIMIQSLLDNQEQPLKIELLTKALFGEGGKLKEPTISEYESLGSFSQALIERLIEFLDLIYRDGHADNEIQSYLPESSYYKEKEVFEKVIQNSANYDEKLRFFAFYGYLAKAKASINTDSDLSNLSDWMRVIYNLTENTITDSSRDFSRALFVINDLLQLDRAILDELKDDCSLTVFQSGQVEEEKIKAHLIQRSDRWRQIIISAEKDTFFNGQVGCILNFSGVLNYYRQHRNCDWTGGDDNQYLSKFTRYFGLLSSIFGQISKGSSCIDYAWERAVLSKGLYCTQASQGRLNLLHSRDGRNNIPRDHSWRRLMRNGNAIDEEKQEYVKAVLDDALLDESDLQGSLEAICHQALSSNQYEPWVAALIESKELFIYSSQGFIAREGNQILLLSQSQRNHYHCELLTKALQLQLESEKERFLPFTNIGYEEVKSREEDAYVSISGYSSEGNTLNISIYKSEDGFLMNVHIKDISNLDAMTKKLSSIGFAQSDTDKQDLKSSSYEIELIDAEEVKDKLYDFFAQF